jgi:hypothetical protein
MSSILRSRGLTSTKRLSSIISSQAIKVIKREKITFDLFISLRVILLRQPLYYKKALLCMAAMVTTMIMIIIIVDKLQIHHGVLVASVNRYLETL